MFISTRTIRAGVAVTVLAWAAVPAVARGEGPLGSGPPAEALAQADPAEEQPADVWEGVRISEAYDTLKCPHCGTKNDLRAAECKRCGHRFPQPSPDVTDPSQVFVPGKGYYREGTLLEPAQSRKILWIPGIVIGAIGLSTLSLALAVWAGETIDGSGNASEGAKALAVGGLVLTAAGASLAIIGFTQKTPAVYAYAGPPTRAPLARADDEAAPGPADDVTIGFALSFNLF